MCQRGSIRNNCSTPVIVSTLRGDGGLKLEQYDSFTWNVMGHTWSYLPPCFHFHSGTKWYLVSIKFDSFSPVPFHSPFLSESADILIYCRHAHPSTQNYIMMGIYCVLPISHKHGHGYSMNRGRQPSVLDHATLPLRDLQKTYLCPRAYPEGHMCPSDLHIRPAGRNMRVPTSRQKFPPSFITRDVMPKIHLFVLACYQSIQAIITLSPHHITNTWAAAEVDPSLTLRLSISCTKKISSWINWVTSSGARQLWSHI